MDFTINIYYTGENVLKNRFNIPQELIPVCLLPLGYKTDECPLNHLHNIRKNIAEIIEYK